MLLLILISSISGSKSNILLLLLLLFLFFLGDKLKASICFSFFEPPNFSFSLFISFKFIEKKRFSTLISLSLSFSGFTSDEINFAFFLVGLTRANNISDWTFLLRSKSILLFVFLSFVKFFFLELYKEFDLFFPLYLDNSSLILFSLSLSFSLSLLILFVLLLILVLLLVVLLGKVTCSVLFNFLGIFIRNLFFKYLQKFMLSLLIGLFI